MKKTLTVFLLLLSSTVFAAQSGKIIVDNANVVEFPQSDAKVIGQAAKDEVLKVSNLPTEGFYKVRTSSGTVGWISGNDILVSTPIKPETKSDPQPPPPPQSLSKSKSDLKEKKRILIAGGMSSLSYGGTPDWFKATALNYSLNALVEGQFIMNKNWFWALRAEFFSASYSNLDVGSSTTQALKNLIIPIQLGIQYSPVTLPKFRLGMGLYLGVSYSSLSISQESSTIGEAASYVSYINPCGTFALQTNIGLSKRVGLLLEAAYRYEQTSAFAASTKLGGISSFKANYSGIVGRLGLEFRF